VPCPGRRIGDRAEAEQRVRRLSVRRSVALAWLDRYYLERREALFEELERENQLLADAVQAQLAGGKGMPADTVGPKQEAAELADRRDELSAALGKEKSTLRRYVGAAGDEPLANDVPMLAIDAQHLRTHVHEHPELAVFAPMLTMAQAEIHEAEATKKPDWGVELAYAKRGPEFSDMVSMQVTVGLPLFTRNRQNPEIATKHQTVTKVIAERDAMLREHTQELETDLADYDALTRQLARMQTTRLPLAQQKVDLQFASYRAGKGDLNAVLTARRDLIAERLKQLDLESQRATTAARLYFAYGEDAQ
jgi:outer membrane protein TolC